MSGRALREMSLDELARFGEEDEVGSVNHGRMMAELARRQTIAQLEATQAQKTASEAEEKAAKAIVETALHTERSANYLFWSVIAATLSTMITAAGVLFHLFGRG
jgi:hypothetical protein